MILVGRYDVRAFVEHGGSEVVRLRDSQMSRFGVEGVAVTR